MLKKWLILIVGILISGWHPLGVQAEKSYRIVTFQPFTLSLKGFRQGIQQSEAADQIFREIESTD
jgi:hypothetical protein